MHIIKNVVTFFDKLEDKVRGFLSKRPILYGIIASLGIVLVWRGIWHMADTVEVLSGPISFILGMIILLLSGVFVSSFIGNRILLTGLKGEKKISDMNAKDLDEALRKENIEIAKLDEIEKSLEKIDGELQSMHKSE